MSIEAARLDELARGLPCSIIDGRVELGSSTHITPLVTSLLRGLSGNLLLESEPELFRLFFKPGDGGNQPGAILFQLASPPGERQRGFDFSCITFAPTNKLSEALISLWLDAGGMPFGRRDVRISSITALRERYGTLHELTPKIASSKCDLCLCTPTLLKNGSRGWIGPDEVKPGHIVQAVCRRLNLLSHYYGNGAGVDRELIVAHAERAVVERARWQWSSSERYSSTQSKSIKLSGVVGRCGLSKISPQVQELLSYAVVVHIGKHASEGCGRVSVVDNSAKIAFKG